MSSIEVPAPAQQANQVILDKVTEIPQGWVATYPDIAEQCNCTPAEVVAALKWAKTEGVDVSDHRVVRSDGRCQSFHKEILGIETLIDFRGRVLDFETCRFQFNGEEPRPAPTPEEVSASMTPPATQPGRTSGGVNPVERAGGEGDLRKLPVLVELLHLLSERENSGGSWFLCNAFAGRGRIAGSRFRSSLSRRRATDNPDRVIRSVESPWRLNSYFRRTLRDLDRGTPSFDGMSLWLVRFACEEAARGVPAHVRLYEEDAETCSFLLEAIERTLAGPGFRTTRTPGHFLLEPSAGLRIEVIRGSWSEDRETIEKLATGKERSLLLIDPPTAYMDNWNALQESSLLSTDGLWSFVFAYSRRVQESPIDREPAWKWGGGPFHYYLFEPQGSPLQEEERERLDALHGSIESALSGLCR